MLSVTWFWATDDKVQLPCKIILILLFLKKPNRLTHSAFKDSTFQRIFKLYWNKNGKVVLVHSALLNIPAGEYSAPCRSPVMVACKDILFNGILKY